MEAVQHFHMVGCIAAVGGIGVLDDVSNTQVAELHALDGVAVAGLTVAQIAGIVGIAGTDCTAQSVVHILVEDAGGDIRGGVPCAVLGGVGGVVLVDGQRAGLVFVNGGFRSRSGEGGGGDVQAQHQSQCHSDDTGKLFHDLNSFHS